MQEKKIAETTRIRLQDVALLADVSISTVSNVLNRKNCVAVATRSRVEHIMKQLNYQPNEHAVALRRTPPTTPLSEGDEDAGDRSDEQEKIEYPAPERHEYMMVPTPCAGQRIQVVLDGSTIHGVVDACMPDGSGFWFWGDGLGRKYISETDGRWASIPEPQPIPGTANLSSASASTSPITGCPHLSPEREPTATSFSRQPSPKRLLTWTSEDRTYPRNKHPIAQTSSASPATHQAAVA